jgi:dipeptidase E
MKKLFLTSVACKVLDKFVELLDCPPSDLTVAFIPTAADVYENKSFVDDDRNKLSELGFKILDINITNKTEEILQEQMKDIDIIFVAGGNTFYLLEKALASGFDKIVKKLVESGKYYIGSSAGSVLAGLTIEPVKLLDDPSKAQNLKSFDGLKLIDKIILPHCGNEKYQDKMNQILKDYSDVKDKIIKLTDNQAAIINDEAIKIISSDD